VIPKAFSPLHQQENFDSLTVKLTEAEVQQVTKEIDKYYLIIGKAWPEFGVENVFA